MLLLFLPIAIANAQEARSDGYEVRWFNYPLISINNHPQKLRKGFVFKKSDKIKWAREWQSMKVVDIKTRKWYQFLAKPSNAEKEESIWEKITHILNRINVFSTHDPEDSPNGFDSLEKSILSEYELIDSIVIKANVPVNETRYFKASYKFNDTIITKKLNYSEGNIIIDKSVFQIGGKLLESEVIPLRIDCIDALTDDEIPVKSDIIFYIVPELIADE